MQKKTVLLIGDSITAGFDEKKLLPELNAVNYGISGDSTVEVLARINDEWFSTKPMAAFLCIGTNDFARNRTDEYILNNIQQIINKLLALCPGLNVIPVSIFPTRDNPLRPNERINEFNGKLALLTKNNSLNYFDINYHFTDEQGKLKSEFTEDGLHLTHEAYLLWAELISVYVKNLI
ncbi:MAG: GDSL-type esterase/lipase family protein [archaeon]